MNKRATFLGGAILLLAAGTGAWSLRPDWASTLWASTLSTGTAEADTIEPPILALPLPPVPPRIAAGAEYETCLDQVATDPWGAAKAAEAWQTSGGEGAIHCLALAVIGMGEPERGAALLEQLAATSQAPAVVRAAIFGQANQAWLMAVEPARAWDAATRAIDLSPHDPDLLIERATAGAALDRYQDSIADLTAALALDPSRTDALVQRSAAWRHLDQLDRAQTSLELALSQDPDNPEALLERGILRQRHNDPTGARQDWERAIALAPDSTTADLAEQNLALLDAGPDRQ